MLWSVVYSAIITLLFLWTVFAVAVYFICIGFIHLLPRSRRKTWLNPTALEPNSVADLPTTIHHIASNPNDDPTNEPRI